MAVTQRILDNNLWDEELRLQEHTAFFLKAKMNNLKVAFTDCASVKHMPVRTKKYNAFRNRDFSKVFMELYGIDKIFATFDHADEVVTFYEESEGR